MATLVLAGLVIVSCSGDDAESESGSESPGTTAESSDSGPTAADLCSEAALVDGAATVDSADLTEISGVAVSRRNDGVTWVHQDSGTPPQVSAVGEDGAQLGHYQVEGAEAFDWEDMSLGGGPQADVDYLYLGDIGDNFDDTVRPDDPVTIYRVAEPELAGNGGDGATAEAVAFEVMYSDGPRDAETMMTDPLTGDLFVVSKQWDASPSGVYRLPADVALAESAPAELVTMERVAELPGDVDPFVTGGDISVDGRLVAVRNYGAVLLWDRAPDATVGETLAADPTCQVDVTEEQGEAVAFDPDGGGFVTVSEGEHPPLQWHLLP
jgi:hypothetical protein